MRWHSLLLTTALLAFASAATPADPEVTVSLRCPPKVAPGRVRCDVDATPAQGASLSWVDVVVLPGSLPPLRGRLAPSDGEVRPERASFPFALLAKDHGPAEVRVAVRAVTCRDGGCQATRVERKVDVTVE